MQNDSTLCFPEFEALPVIYSKRVVAFLDECPTPPKSEGGWVWKSFVYFVAAYVSSWLQLLQLVAIYTKDKDEGEETDSNQRIMPQCSWCSFIM